MKKQEYMKPAMHAVSIKLEGIICTSITGTDGLFGLGGGGNGDARAPELEEDWVEKAYQFGGWDVEW